MVPKLRPVMGYDHDPFAAREGRAPIRRGLMLDFTQAVFIPHRHPAQDASLPSLTVEGPKSMDNETKLKLMTYLADYLGSKELTEVSQIVSGKDADADAPDDDDNRQAAAAMDRALQRRRARSLLPSTALQQARDARFPNAKRLG